MLTATGGYKEVTNDPSYPDHWRPVVQVCTMSPNHFHQQALFSLLTPLTRMLTSIGLAVFLHQCIVPASFAVGLAKKIGRSSLIVEPTSSTQVEQRFPCALMLHTKTRSRWSERRSRSGSAPLPTQSLFSSQGGGGLELFLIHAHATWSSMKKIPTVDFALFTCGNVLKAQR